MEFETLKSTRKYYRSKATRTCNFVTDNFANLTLEATYDYIEDLKSLKVKLLNLDAEVLNCFSKRSSDEKDLEKELEACDEYESKIVQRIRALETSVQPQQKQPGVSLLNSSSNVSSKLNLPNLPLPEFSSAKTECLEKFLYGFESIVDKHNLGQYEKFIYLTKQLRGNALTLVQSLSAREQSYDIARDLLIQAFASPLNQKFEVIERLVNLKLEKAGEPIKYISEFRTLLDMIVRLEIDVDTIVQYFVWNGLNETFKNVLTSITNKSKPSLKEIRDHIFEAKDRYLTALQSKSTSDYQRLSDQPVIGLATNIDYKAKQTQNVVKSKFKPCLLCTSGGTSADHPIFKCVKFPDPKSKFEELKSKKCCIKCANDNHKSSDCKFKFKRPCAVCHKDHFDFLCLAKFKNDKTRHELASNVITTGSVSVNSMTLSFKDSKSVLLPTFVCTTKTGNELRCLLDSGSQCNFINEAVAKKANFPVIESKIEIKINGFNSSQAFITDVVEISANLGSKIVDVLAICVPKINTRLKLPGLAAVAKGYNNAGFDLADKKLLNSDVIENLDLVLGSGSSFCLPTETVTLGSSSSCLKTPLGLILMGPICMLKNNLNQMNDSCKFEAENVNIAMNINSTEPEKPNPELFEFNVNHIVVDDSGKLLQSELLKVTDEAVENESDLVLEHKCKKLLDYDYDETDQSSENSRLINQVLDKTFQNENGRLVMPLTWNSKVSHMLGKNFGLSRQILYSNLRKLKSSPEKLSMVDKVIAEQLELGIITKIDNIDKFVRDNNNCSFLAHMPIFKMDKDSTKCRIVFLSNLSGKENDKSLTLSNNQCMLAGPCINNKLTTSVINLRFDKFVLCFDLVKAFLQIQLSELDQQRLCFLWFRNPQAGDFTLVGYKNERLSFGLKCSPTLLMLALYKILMIDVFGDDDDVVELKKNLYHHFYMDNGAFTSNDENYMKWAYTKLNDIFLPYKFPLQQFYTNCPALQSQIDEEQENESKSQVKLLGLQWDRDKDILSTNKLFLDSAADTKRTILRSIASNFDVYNFNGPLLNRARFFLHRLQMSKLGWDKNIGKEHMNEWKNICKQFNSSPDVSVDRFVGRKKDEYELVAFTDSSKVAGGVVIYLKNLTTNRVSLLMAKNRIVSSKFEDKSIPSLEFYALTLGVEVLIDTYNELSGQNAVIPINIKSCQLYTDSLICLSWLSSYCSKFDKMNKRSVFIMNRLNRIAKLCEVMPIHFKFCNGIANPADCMTRTLSYKQLMKSNFLSGPVFLLEGRPEEDELLSVRVPNPLITSPKETQVPEVAVEAAAVEEPEPGNPLCTDMYSSFSRLLKVSCYVVKFIRNLKSKVAEKYNRRKPCVSDRTVDMEAFNLILRLDQKQHFSSELSYLRNKTAKLNKIPDLVNQLNLYIDSNGLLKVKSKFGKFNSKFHPVLLSKNSDVSLKIITHYHEKCNHTGVYGTLNRIRKEFWIPKIFSLVKSTLSKCVHCNKMNGRAIKINQSDYREFRVNPPKIPFRAIFIDYIGPFVVTDKNSIKQKVYLLLFTCLWSRSVNLKLCADLSLREFVRSFQLHCFEYGLPESCHSDLGSQIVAGAKLITLQLDDEDCKQYFIDNGVSPLVFKQFPKGRKELGGIVETCVKMVKRLIQGAVGKNVLCLKEFEFLMHQTIHLVNKRPVSFKESLRDNEDIPSPITPELVVKGYHLTSLNIVPQLNYPNLDDDWYNNIDTPDSLKDDYEKLSKVRRKLMRIYNEEFLAVLISQATNKKGAYMPVKHKAVDVGDIVLLVEDNTKRCNFPMGRVLEINMNDLQEVTDVVVLKGNTKEKVSRHVTSLIPVLQVREPTNSDLYPTVDKQLPVDNDSDVRGCVNRRQAAIRSEHATQTLYSDGLL